MIKLVLAPASVLLTVSAWAQERVLTDAEVTKAFSGKTLIWKLADGKNYEIRHDTDGKATASGTYNDVGTWRVQPGVGSCTAWNKQRPAEVCVKLAMREGVLTAINSDGSVRGTLVSSN
ncbi:DUF995 domain-containing protein [Variovorax dokdonensis]|uniref:DUF995 domain-containing protein n=1 Tax=Variovorax dokdonensis TaxID=344883 RepID=A0ABT7NCX5_9BURK|nr:DUF995 domain-containing protein [Variovorax dokdonensis]MDM0045710.1 DUF995 domain-containing protein [Variovorax dokdonensis]